MFDRFSDRARKTMSYARMEAERLNHDYIGTEHILLGLIKVGSGVAATVLKDLKVDLAKVRDALENLVKPAPDIVTTGQLPFTPRAKKVLEFAIDEARALDHNYVGTEHLLLGLLREEEGLAAQVLTMNFGLTLEGVREGVMAFRAANPCPAAQKTPTAKGRFPQNESQNVVSLSIALEPGKPANAQALGAFVARLLPGDLVADGWSLSPLLDRKDHGWRLCCRKDGAQFEIVFSQEPDLIDPILKISPVCVPTPEPQAAGKVVGATPEQLRALTRFVHAAMVKKLKFNLLVLGCWHSL